MWLVAMCCVILKVAKSKPWPCTQFHVPSDIFNTNTEHYDEALRIGRINCLVYTISLTRSTLAAIAILFLHNILTDAPMLFSYQYRPHDYNGFAASSRELSYGSNDLFLTVNF